MKRSRFVLGAALALGLLLGAADGLRAEEPGWSYELSRELMSPFCPGRTLVDCPSTQATELRDWIRRQEELGQSRAEVEAQLLARFGEVVRQTPDPRGFGLAAYVIPAGVLVAGGALVVWFLRRQTRAAPPPSVARAEPMDPELERLVDRELEGR